MEDIAIERVTRQIRDIEGRLERDKETNELSVEAHAALLDRVDQLDRERRRYSSQATAPPGAQKDALLQEIELTKERLDNLSTADEGLSVEDRVRLDVERERAALQARELERRLEFIAHDDAMLQTAVEDGLIEFEELMESIAQVGSNSARGQRLEREREAAQMRVAEVQRELNDRAGRAAVAKLQSQTQERALLRAAHEAWRVEGQRRIAEAEGYVADGHPSWWLQKARDEAQGEPPAEFIERFRHEIGG